jgi:hypothetical protein
MKLIGKIMLSGPNALNLILAPHTHFFFFNELDNNCQIPKSSGYSRGRTKAYLKSFLYSGPTLCLVVTSP